MYICSLCDHRRAQHPGCPESLCVLGFVQHPPFSPEYSPHGHQQHRAGTGEAGGLQGGSKTKGGLNNPPRGGSLLHYSSCCAHGCGEAWTGGFYAFWLLPKERNTFYLLTGSSHVGIWNKSLMQPGFPMLCKILSEIFYSNLLCSALPCALFYLFKNAALNPLS